MCALPIFIKATADNIWPISTNHTLLYQTGQCIDTNGRPVIALWYAPQGTGTPIQYNVIWNDGAQWRTNQVGNRVGTGTPIQYNVIRSEEHTSELQSLRH